MDIDKVQSPQAVYAEELFSCGRGRALYIPEPLDHLPLEYKRRGIHIGDVGVFRPGGSFEYFFSIAYPAQDPINKHRYGVPDRFEVYEPLRAHHDPAVNSTDLAPESHQVSSAGGHAERDAEETGRIGEANRILQVSDIQSQSPTRVTDSESPSQLTSSQLPSDVTSDPSYLKYEMIWADNPRVTQVRQMCPPKTVIVSENMKCDSVSIQGTAVLATPGTDFNFTCRSSRGAALVLPNGAASSQFNEIEGLNRWLAKHADQWFKFVRSMLREDPPTLSVITGAYHAKSWALYAYANSSTVSDISMKLKVPHIGTDFAANLSWESPSGFGRTCAPRQQSPHALWNQAVFVSCINISKPSTLFTRMKGMRNHMLTARFKRKSRAGSGDGGDPDSYMEVESVGMNISTVASELP